jgi:diguanylate cyclase (GGDEF)-like protein/PAS domain S-box-containing protein
MVGTWMMPFDPELIAMASDDPRLATWEWISATDQLRWTSVEIYSRPAEEVNNTASWMTLVHPDDRERLGKAVEHAVEAGNGFREPFRVIGAHGETLWILGHARVIRDPDGAVRLLGLNIDVTDWVDALADSEARFSATFEQAAVGIAHVGLDGTWLNVNRRCLEIVGYRKEELLKLTFADITHPDDLATDWSLVHELLRGERQTYSMEKRYFAKDQRQVWVNLTVSLVRKKDGTPDYFISVIEDITARKQIEAERDGLIEALEQRVRERTADLEKLSLTDPLTGIANRRCLDDRLEIEWKRAVRTRQPLSVLLIDVDHFKSLNDGFGHATADRALISIASGLNHLARRSSDLAARYGGDEFVLVLPDTGLEGAEIVARQFQEMVRAIDLRTPESPVAPAITVSQGVATAWPGTGGTCWSMLSDADRALYRAKHSGRDQFAVHGRAIEGQAAPSSNSITPIQ